MKKKRIAVAVLLGAVLSGLLSALLIVSTTATEPPFRGEALTYYQQLQGKGFPRDYAEQLTHLHLLYPTWEFEPLPVSARTWREALALETATPTVNLIHKSESYAAYRHAGNSQTYDSGVYYQASTAAIAYFMDPRNFLNEADLFQFYDQRAAGNWTEEALDAVLSGTFMDGAVLENGSTYAEYLLELGEELDIDPVFLAVKLRQEQGAGTSPLLSGKCGTLLAGYYESQTATTSDGKPIKPPAPGTMQTAELIALDGYYNLFNIKASGDGVFSIYYGAMQYAKSHSWNTKWKALRGGAEFLRKDYIEQGQSNIYLQKFDVNTATGSLHQYMQNVAGAMSEGRLLYRFFAENGLTDLACRFQIPVFTAMPTKPSPDPASGSCTALASAGTRFTYTVGLTAPVTQEAQAGAVFASLQLPHNGSLTLSGTVTHDYGIAALEYAWDGGAWITCANSGSLALAFDTLPEWGEHLLVVRARLSFGKTDLATHSLCAVLHVTVVPPPEVTLTLRSGSAEVVKRRYAGDRYTLPACADAGFAGYVGSDSTFYPSGYTLTLTSNVTYTAVFLDLHTLPGASLYIGAPEKGATHLRFEAAVNAQALALLPSDCITFQASLFRNSTAESVHTVLPEPYTDASGNTGMRVTLRTDDLITQADLQADFSASFSATLHYSNGKTHTVLASGSARRTALGVASAALADVSTSYPEQIRDYLQALLS